MQLSAGLSWCAACFASLPWSPDTWRKSAGPSTRSTVGQYAEGHSFLTANRGRVAPLRIHLYGAEWQIGHQIAKTRVFAGRGARIRASNDQLERFRAAALIDDLDPIPGTNAARVHCRSKTNRFLAPIVIQSS